MARILLIDDDDALRTVLRKTLTHCGHQVIEAHDGREGLRLFAQSGADLVITDIVMPEKEGLAVLMELRKQNLAVKIIAMSGGGRQSADEYLHMAKLLGATKILAKPFTYQELAALLTELLD